MSRGYRIRWPQPVWHSASEKIESEDGISMDVGILEILPEAEMLALLREQLAAAGWTEAGDGAMRTIGIWQGSAAEQAQEMVPEGVTVVSALHTVSAPGLADLSHAMDEDVPVCGDRKADKARVAELIARIDGLRPINAGALEISRIVEQLTALMISVNIRYKTHAGLKFTNLPGGDAF